MPRLSNFFRGRDASNPGSAEGFTYRQVQRHEIEPALRLILATDQGLATDDTVLDFLGFAIQRKIDVNLIWIATDGQSIIWALLPITSPGKTMLLFTPARIPAGTPTPAARELTNRICEHYKNQQMQLAQFLLDPEDASITELYISCGFEVLAELIYLHKPVNGAVPERWPAGFDLLSYSPATHDLFASTILQTYEGSLDCPALNGKRNIEDVILGHKSTGQFEPTLWKLIMERDEPRGVLILSPSPHTEAMELVYIGLTPQGRNRGLGSALIRLATASASRFQKSELSLAVDSRNSPALRLYYRHGLKRIGSRIAMVRDLAR